MYVNRTYREAFSNKDLRGFRVIVRETDLYVSVDQSSFSPDLEQKVEKLILALRYDLETYISSDSEFKTTLQPHLLAPGAPVIARTMAAAANTAGVGPMAAVAGAFAETIGRELLKLSSEVIVENGGDIFMASPKKRLAGVFAGTSPFSGRLAVEVPPDKMPLGICTSSGTVGPSFSFGRADATVIISRSTALADAAASAAGNAVQTGEDVKKGIEVAKSIPGVLGAVLIKDDKMAVWGEFNIVPVSPLNL